MTVFKRRAVEPVQKSVFADAHVRQLLFFRYAGVKLSCKHTFLLQITASVKQLTEVYHRRQKMANVWRKVRGGLTVCS